MTYDWWGRVAGYAVAAAVLFVASCTAPAETAPSATVEATDVPAVASTTPSSEPADVVGSSDKNSDIGEVMAAVSADLSDSPILVVIVESHISQQGITAELFSHLTADRVDQQSIIDVVFRGPGWSELSRAVPGALVSLGASTLTFAVRGEDSFWVQQIPPSLSLWHEGSSQTFALSPETQVGAGFVHDPLVLLSGANGLGSLLVAATVTTSEPTVDDVYQLTVPTKTLLRWVPPAITNQADTLGVELDSLTGSTELRIQVRSLQLDTVKFDLESLIDELALLGVGINFGIEMKLTVRTTSSRPTFTWPDVGNVDRTLLSALGFDEAETQCALDQRFGYGELVTVFAAISCTSRPTEEAFEALLRGTLSFRSAFDGQAYDPTILDSCTRRAIDADEVERLIATPAPELEASLDPLVLRCTLEATPSLTDVAAVINTVALALGRGTADEIFEVRSGGDGISLWIHSMPPLVVTGDTEDGGAKAITVWFGPAGGDHETVISAILRLLGSDMTADEVDPTKRATEVADGALMCVVDERSETLLIFLHSSLGCPSFR